MNLDIRSWMMHHVADSSKFENMFKGMGTSGMQSITLGPYAVLENTGFGSVIPIPNRTSPSCQRPMVAGLWAIR